MKMLESSVATTPLTPEEESRIYQPDQEWSDEFALKVAVQDFQQAETFRTAQHDWRWRTHFALYESYVEQKPWEGTRIPRSSLPIYLCFEQIESMLPRILSAIFANRPWFEAEPEPGTSADAARAARDLLRTQLDQMESPRQVVLEWIKSGLIHGDGIMSLSWIQKETKRKKYIPTYQQQFHTIKIGEQEQQIPAGFKRILQMKTETDIENRPELEFINLTDFYIDPNTSSVSPKHKSCRYAATRHLLDVDTVDALRQNKEFNIPPKELLHVMAKHKSSAQGDITKSGMETARGGFWNPQIDQTVDPGGKRIEVIKYCQNERYVYVLNREWCAYNQPNPYGFKPFYHFSYAQVLGRFYSLGMCDVLEGEQRFRASLRNARVDEISLNIHRPMIKRRGISTPTYMLRARPGQVLEAENPKEDFAFPDPPNVLQSAYIEDQYSQAEAQRVTGMTDLVASGMGQAGGNSASRTATGIGAQVSAGSSRIQFQVENCEDIGIEPMLNDMLALNQIYPPISNVQVKGQNGATYPVSPEVIINSNIKFKLRASAKMRARQALMQALPLVLQTIMNPALRQQLAERGERINFKELLNMVLEMTGYETMNDLILPLTPQEKQAMNQPPSKDMLHMQMQKERLASHEKTTTQKLAAQAESESSQQQMELVRAIMAPTIKMMTEEPKK